MPLRLPSFSTRVRLGLLTTFLLMVPCWSATAQERPLTEWETRARALLKELIEYNTTRSAGDMTRAAEAMAVHMRAAGFPDSDVVVIEARVARKGNLIVRLRGRDRSMKPIMLLSHHDVVEANPEDWTLPPFEFIEREGTFYGRGVSDNKDEGALHLTILLRLKAEGWVPEQDIIVPLTTDEEGGPHNGVAWLLEHRRDLIDAGYVLNEGGGGRIGPSGEKVSNEVQASEKRVVNFQLEVTREAAPSPPSPLTPSLLQEIERVTEEMWPGTPVIPTMSTGATDGMYLRNAGIPVYGVSGLFYGNSNAHGMNEHIPVKGFYQGLEFMYRLVKALTRPGIS